MIQKKICMIGASGVGKTSLIAKFVHSMFSDKYLTTVGVKIDKKTVSVDGAEVMLMIWDLAGDDDFQRLQISYLRGTSGYLLVADGTRRMQTRNPCQPNSLSPAARTSTSIRRRWTPTTST